MLGLLSGVGLKFLLAGGVAVIMASSCAYGIHTLKAAGANEVAMKVSRDALKVQQDEISKQKADVKRLTASNEKLQGLAGKRRRELQAAIAAIPNVEASDECPANCLLPSS